MPTCTSRGFLALKIGGSSVCRNGTEVAFDDDPVRFRTFNRVTDMMVRAAACYDHVVTPDDIRRFMTRDWARIGSAKDRTWVAGKGAPAADLGAADQLRQYVVSVRADWPDPDDRAADLQAHLRVSEALGAVIVRSAPARERGPVS